MAYTNKARIQNLLMISIANAFDSQIEEWVDVIEAYIDNYCQTSFETEAAASKRYDGDGTDTILVDDFTSLTKIEILDLDGSVDETLDNSSYWYLYPANKIVKQKIVINGANAPIAEFPEGNQNVKVYASFGFSTSVPEPIRYVATRLVAAIIKESKTDVTADVDAERLGEYNVSMENIDKMVDRLGFKEILDQYKKIVI